MKKSLISFHFLLGLIVAIALIFAFFKIGKTIMDSLSTKDVLLEDLEKLDKTMKSLKEGEKTSVLLKFKKGDALFFFNKGDIFYSKTEYITGSAGVGVVLEEEINIIPPEICKDKTCLCICDLNQEENKKNIACIQRKCITDFNISLDMKCGYTTTSVSYDFKTGCILGNNFKFNDIEINNIDPVTAVIVEKYTKENIKISKQE